jgi:hypothetical protein
MTTDQSDWPLTIFFIAEKDAEEWRQELEKVHKGEVHFSIMPYSVIEGKEIIETLTIMNMTPKELLEFIEVAVAVVVANDDGNHDALQKNVEKLSEMMCTEETEEFVK